MGGRGRRDRRWRAGKVLAVIFSWEGVGLKEVGGHCELGGER